ncbi:nucleoside phosphorylase [Oscillochloris sp. ZM17-4]|uniref:nucleoside phosphorylase n=1 Tax=Oscillochloris sp. ZM17-4 TaxID=2866714 RepID=UPI001C7342A7|nr:nucleoside phosphorylase [Oscillochloris sp. ZM17-4]MBX0329608.1 nucleoside phosphorylase [Oscillochloris sp. ZM17-4]
MPLPQLPAKYQSPAVFEPIDHLDYFRGVGLAPSGPPPQGVIFCYQRSLLKHILAEEAPEPLPCVVGRLYPLPSTGGAVAVAAEFGIGAPAAAMLIELLIAMGVRRFVSIGTAGGIDPRLQIGDLTACTEAYRDEGVSHHYLEGSAPTVAPDPALSAAFAQALDRSGAPATRGPTWTTDAAFRETRAEIAHYQERGVLSVEMEAAALFAICAVRGAQIAGGFVISDVLAAPAWEPQFRAEATAAGLVRLFEAAKTTLA